eukprot:7018259-Pyramimonas_sp.AAC.1
MRLPPTLVENSRITSGEHHQCDRVSGDDKVLPLPHAETRHQTSGDVRHRVAKSETLMYGLAEEKKAIEAAPFIVYEHSEDEESEPEEVLELLPRMTLDDSFDCPDFLK